MFKRDLESTLLEYTRFPVIALLGPRQSGKTTLVRSVFSDYAYTSFEDPRTREIVEADPEAFLRLNENKFGIIIDEFQNVPQILSYIQLEVDTKKRPGYFVLTGSQNFLMNQAISQSLAGRVGIVTLLPLSIHELTTNKLANKSVEDSMLSGFYPRIYEEKFPPTQLYPSYLQTYVERDVRQLSNVGDLNAFKKFIKLCAGRVGQIINFSEIGGVCGISAPTAQRWISILEASYIIFQLQPYFNNFNKRQIQAPKLYFYDTGLVCSLLDIETPQQLAVDRLYGSLFENLIIADIHKQFFNRGKRPPVYFWRDKNGRIEVDCIIDEGKKLFPIEIKSSRSISVDFFSNLKKWNEIVQAEPITVGKSYLIYGGEKTHEWDELGTIGWKDAGSLTQLLKK